MNGESKRNHSEKRTFLHCSALLIVLLGLNVWRLQVVLFFVFDVMRSQHDGVKGFTFDNEGTHFWRCHSLRMKVLKLKMLISVDFDVNTRVNTETLAIT